jgi:hypothetical protein
LNERFEQYINGKRENFHSNSPVRLKKKLVGISHYGHFRWGFNTLKSLNLTNGYPNNNKNNRNKNKNKNSKVKSKPLELFELTGNKSITILLASKKVLNQAVYGRL